MPFTNSIFGQKAHELSDTDFIPLYYAAGTQIKRRTPDELYHMLQQRLLIQNKFYAAALMTLLDRACEKYLGNNSQNARTHVIIFSFLFALIIAPQLQRFADGEEQTIIHDPITTAHDPRIYAGSNTMQVILHCLIKDVMHVIKKYIIECFGDVNYDDLLISALIGMPISRMDGTTNPPSHVKRIHVSSHYEVKRFRLTQEIIIRLVNPVLKKLGRLPYHDKYTEAGFMTLPARRLLQAINVHPELNNLWKEMLHLKANHSEALNNFELSNNVGFMAKFLYDQAVDAGNYDWTYRSQHTVQVIKADLQSVIQQFNLQLEKQLRVRFAEVILAAQTDAELSAELSRMMTSRSSSETGGFGSLNAFTEQHPSSPAKKESPVLLLLKRPRGQDVKAAAVEAEALELLPAKEQDPGELEKEPFRHSLLLI